MRAQFCFILFVLFPAVLVAQNKPGLGLSVRKAKADIILDGVLDEQDWHSADVAKDWYYNYPTDTSMAAYQTEARVTFDDQNLYLSFVCYDDSTRDIVYSLRRDFDYDLNDNVGFILGPYNDHLNGFFFVITPAGVQMEGTVTGGGAGNSAFSSYWDNKWMSKVVRYPDKWIAELAIPFKSFRYKSDVKEWDIAFDRADRKRNCRSTWIHTPIQYQSTLFAFGGQLIWEDPIPPAHTNLSIIPYAAGNVSRDNEIDPPMNTSEVQFGLDTKFSITPSMNLDLTINPDFSQVEVDQQVINLTRFEFRFPERRQFFLENSDLYERAGLAEVRPFFSRRIGLVRDSSGLFRRLPILFGARLSGSLNSNWRLSVSNMQTKEELDVGLPSQNYTVATVQRNFWNQSSLAVTFVDKESLNVNNTDQDKYFHESIFKEVDTNGSPKFIRNTFNRILGADLEMLSKDNKIHSSSFAAQSFNNLGSNKTFSAGTFFEYTLRRFYTSVKTVYIGENFTAEAGYVPSAGVYPGQFLIKNVARLVNFPANPSIVKAGPVATVDHFFLPSGELTDRNYTLGYRFDFANTSVLEGTLGYVYQKLTKDFSFIDDELYTPLVAGEEYDWSTVSVMYQSNLRNIFNYTIQTLYGGFYNGTNLNINGQVNVRYQPYGNISLMFDFNKLELAEGYGKENLFLIGPRIDLTLTDRLFITNYLQYNNLIDNVNLNARLQWRYKPASDFFIVYTENYLPGNWMSKNRALVFKLTYWFNL